jgi:hypothetical protein
MEHPHHTNQVRDPRVGSFGRLLGWTLIFLLCFQSTACAAQPHPQSEFNTPFTLQLEQTILLPESQATLSFVEVLQDARCPTRVECETHGPVLVSLAFQQPDQDPILLDMNPEPGLAALGHGETTREVSSFVITLLSVDPYPTIPEDLNSTDHYTVKLVVAPYSPYP